MYSRYYGNRPPLLCRNSGRFPYHCEPVSKMRVTAHPSDTGRCAIPRYLAGKVSYITDSLFAGSSIEPLEPRGQNWRNRDRGNASRPPYRTANWNPAVAPGVKRGGFGGDPRYHFQVWRGFSLDIATMIRFHSDTINPNPPRGRRGMATSRTTQHRRAMGNPSNNDPRK